MNKRLKKKKLRRQCPRCNSWDGLFGVITLTTGRHVDVFCCCLDCDYGWKFTKKENET